MDNIEKLIKNLNTRGFKARYFETSDRAIGAILSLISQGATVGIGGSMTVAELGLDKLLRANGATVYSSSMIAPELKDQLFQLAQSSDWYLSSANAITVGGDIVNIDGNCNRVTSLLFGVKNIIYLVGKNKITDNLDEAINRIRNVVAPKNAVRLNRNTPCKITGKCSYCNCPDCMCNATTICHHPTRYQSNVYVFVVNEDLGY